eukprot:765988-Hanusia_phi.AAC.27
MQIAIDHCNSALSLDGRNAKALYRKRAEDIDAAPDVLQQASASVSQLRGRSESQGRVIGAVRRQVASFARSSAVLGHPRLGDGGRDSTRRQQREAKAEARAISQQELASKELKQKEQEDADARDDDISQLFGMLRMAREEVSNLSDADRREKAAAYMEKVLTYIDVFASTDVRPGSSANEIRRRGRWGGGRRVKRFAVQE